MNDKGIATTLIVLGIIAAAALIFASDKFPPKVCTADAKLCPDGSYVGRNPYNNCQFRPCPTKTTTVTKTTTIV